MVTFHPSPAPPRTYAPPCACWRVRVCVRVSCGGGEWRGWEGSRVCASSPPAAHGETITCAILHATHTRAQRCHTRSASTRGVRLSRMATATITLRHGGDVFSVRLAKPMTMDSFVHAVWRVAARSRMALAEFEEAHSFEDAEGNLFFFAPDALADGAVVVLVLREGGAAPVVRAPLSAPSPRAPAPTPPAPSPLVTAAPGADVLLRVTGHAHTQAPATIESPLVGGTVAAAAAAASTTAAPAPRRILTHPCTACEKQFSTPAFLNAHIARRHTAPPRTDLPAARVLPAPLPELRDASPRVAAQKAGHKRARSTGARPPTAASTQGAVRSERVATAKEAGHELAVAGLVNPVRVSRPMDESCFSASRLKSAPYAEGISRLFSVSCAPSTGWTVTSKLLSLRRQFGHGDGAQAKAEAYLLKALAQRGLPESVLYRRGYPGEGGAAGAVGAGVADAGAGAGAGAEALATIESPLVEGTVAAAVAATTTTPAPCIPTYPCSACPKRFLTPAFLDAHVARRHAAPPRADASPG